MKKSYFVFASIVAFVVAAYLVLDAKYPSMTIRYKITVEVETPEGIKTGSAVRELSASAPFVKLPDAGTQTTLKGEAVVVDLGARGMLFALLGEDAKYLVYKAFPYHGGWTSIEGIRHYKNLKNVKATLAPSDYPKFVRFRDINDPKTVENLLELESDGRHPSTFTIKKDRFAEAFGAGVKLKSVTIEMTDEPVTWGIAERYMPSYRPIEDYMKWVNALKYSDPRRIGPDSFRKGK